MEEQGVPQHPVQSGKVRGCSRIGCSRIALVFQEKTDSSLRLFACIYFGFVCGNRVGYNIASCVTWDIEECSPRNFMAFRLSQKQSGSGATELVVCF